MDELYSSFVSLSVSDLEAGFLMSKNDDDDNHHDDHYFLESCFLCKKTLTHDCDVYMYKGDVAFCSEECREEQMEMDEASERKFRLSIKQAKEKKKPTSTSATKSVDIHIRGAVVAASTKILLLAPLS